MAEVEESLPQSSHLQENKTKLHSTQEINLRNFKLWLENAAGAICKVSFIKYSQQKPRKII